MGLGSKRPLIRRVLRLTLTVIPFAMTVAFSLWALSQNPFAQPLVDRSAVEVQQALDRALARQVTPDWLHAEMDAALTARDFDQVTTLALIGADQGLAPGPETQARIDTLEAEVTGPWATVRDCGICMADIAACPSIGLMATCSIPVELTPVGDLNALRRAAQAMLSSEEVDKIDVGLACVGLVATGAILVSGGTSVPVKAGATALRLARKLGTLTPRFGRELGLLADIGLKPRLIVPLLRREVPIEAVLDTARLSRLTAVAGDVARIAERTSITDAVVLMRQIDTAEDATRLARVAEVSGPKTRRVVEVLGKGRVFRALVRVSHLTLAAAAALYLWALQTLVFLAHLVGRGAVKGLRRYV